MLRAQYNQVTEKCWMIFWFDDWQDCRRSPYWTFWLRNRDWGETELGEFPSIRILVGVAESSCIPRWIFCPRDGLYSDTVPEDSCTKLTTRFPENLKHKARVMNHVKGWRRLSLMHIEILWTIFYKTCMFALCEYTGRVSIQNPSSIIIITKPNLGNLKL